jgi:hypothetical protein
VKRAAAIAATQDLVDDLIDVLRRDALLPQHAELPETRWRRVEWLFDYLGRHAHNVALHERWAAELKGQTPLRALLRQ